MTSRSASRSSARSTASSSSPTSSMALDIRQDAGWTGKHDAADPARRRAALRRLRRRSLDRQQQRRRPPRRGSRARLVGPGMGVLSRWRGCTDLRQSRRRREAQDRRSPLRRLGGRPRVRGGRHRARLAPAARSTPASRRCITSDRRSTASAAATSICRSRRPLERGRGAAQRPRVRGAPPRAQWPRIRIFGTSAAARAAALATILPTSPIEPVAGHRRARGRGSNRGRAPKLTIPALTARPCRRGASARPRRRPATGERTS